MLLVNHIVVFHVDLFNITLVLYINREREHWSNALTLVSPQSHRKMEAVHEMLPHHTVYQNNLPFYRLYSETHKRPELHQVNTTSITDKVPPFSLSRRRRTPYQADDLTLRQCMRAHHLCSS